MMETSPPENRYIVPGLVRGMRLLEQFTHKQQEWRLSELARTLNMPRSTVFRLVHTLEQLKYLEHHPQRKTYQLGNRVLNLGFEYLASQELIEVARPFLTTLNEKTGCSVHLGVLDEREVVYLLRIAGRQHLVSNVGVGTRFPAHATTLGRVLLSELSLQELNHLYEGIELRRITEQTDTTVQDLHQRLCAEHQLGYALSLSAFEAGVVSVELESGMPPERSLRPSTSQVRKLYLTVRLWKVKSRTSCCRRRKPFPIEWGIGDNKG
jgi:IclR family pca regulon transcriptional regulator